jgi:hypothetical protein
MSLTLLCLKKAKLLSEQAWLESIKETQERYSQDEVEKVMMNDFFHRETWTI